LIQLSGLAQALSLASKDTIRCYTPSELRSIALKLIDGKECDTLLKTARLEIGAKDTVIASQSRELVKQENRYYSCERLVKEKEIQITGLKEDKKKIKLKLTLTQIGWAVTTVGLSVLTVLALIH
jgi:hypothetical protein